MSKKGFYGTTNDFPLLLVFRRTRVFWSAMVTFILSDDQRLSVVKCHVGQEHELSPCIYIHMHNVRKYDALKNDGIAMIKVPEHRLVSVLWDGEGKCGGRNNWLNLTKDATTKHSRVRFAVTLMQCW
jgi:hypothetical protein